MWLETKQVWRASHCAWQDSAANGPLAGTLTSAEPPTVPMSRLLEWGTFICGQAQ